LHIRDRRAPSDEGRHHDRYLEGHHRGHPTGADRNLIPQSHHTAYERLLAVGLGVAMAAVATVALLLPTDTTVDPAAGSTQTVAQGKATPRTTAGSISAADTTSVE
jgi:hypothetical protein